MPETKLDALRQRETHPKGCESRSQKQETLSSQQLLPKRLRRSDAFNDLRSHAMNLSQTGVLRFERRMKPGRALQILKGLARNRAWANGKVVQQRIQRFYVSFMEHYSKLSRAP